MVLEKAGGWTQVDWARLSTIVADIRPGKIRRFNNTTVWPGQICRLHDKADWQNARVTRLEIPRPLDQLDRTKSRAQDQNQGPGNRHDYVVPGTWCLEDPHDHMYLCSHEALCTGAYFWNNFSVYPWQGISRVIASWQIRGFDVIGGQVDPARIDGEALDLADLGVATDGTSAKRSKV